MLWSNMGWPHLEPTDGNWERDDCPEQMKVVTRVSQNAKQTKAQVVWCTSYIGCCNAVLIKALSDLLVSARFGDNRKCADRPWVCTGCGHTCCACLHWQWNTHCPPLERSSVVFTLPLNSWQNFPNCLPKIFCSLYLFLYSLLQRIHLFICMFMFVSSWVYVYGMHKCLERQVEGIRYSGSISDLSCLMPALRTESKFSARVAKFFQGFSV